MASLWKLSGSGGWVKARYRVLCETREIGCECVTARKEEKVCHVSPFLPTLRLSAELCDSARASLRLRAATHDSHRLTSLARFTAWVREDSGRTDRFWMSLRELSIPLGRSRQSQTDSVDLIRTIFLSNSIGGLGYLRSLIPYHTLYLQREYLRANSWMSSKKAS